MDNLRERLLLQWDRAAGKKFFHILHVRKAGGTAVRLALEPHTRGPGRRVLLYHHKTTLRDVPVGDRVVFFLRDPVTRFVSGFYSRQRQGRPMYHRPWSSGEERVFQRFATPNDLALALSSEDRETRAAAVDAMGTVRHLWSCWHWFGDEEYFLSRLDDICLVGRQETLNDDFERLKLSLGLPAGVALPQEDDRAHRAPGGLNRTLDEQAKRNVQAWYAADYRLLELCAEHADRINYRPPPVLSAR